MVPNVVGLVIVPSIFVVNELYTSWKEKQRCLDRDTGSRQNDYVFPLITENVKAFHFITFFLADWTCWLGSRFLGQGARVCILREVDRRERLKHRENEIGGITETHLD